MRIEVTADDLANGVPGNPCRCPVALALERATGSRWYVTAHGARHPMEFRYLPLPEEVVWLLNDFDLRRPTAPLAFDVALVSIVSWNEREGHLFRELAGA